jgi:hypothetical protein
MGARSSNAVADEPARPVRAVLADAGAERYIRIRVKL